MFSSIGWGEILVIVVLAFLIIGPDRLPEVVKQAKAVRLAVKNAVAEARKQIDGEFGEEIRGLSEPIQEIAEPLRKINSVRSMTPTGLVTSMLREGTEDSGAAAAVNTIDATLKKTPKAALQDFFAQESTAPTPATSATPAAPAAPASDTAATVAHTPQPIENPQPSSRRPHRLGLGIQQ